MGVTTSSGEQTYLVSPTRLFKASIVDSHNLIPKLMPEAIKSIDILHGNGGTGSIKQINFPQGSHLESLKYHIDELNEETLTYNYTLIEGGPLTEFLEKITCQVKFEAAAAAALPADYGGGGGGGSTSKVICKYYTKGDFKLNEEEIGAGKEKVLGLFKVVEAYLLDNPNAYA